MLSETPSSNIFIIDFGLTKKFIDPSTNQHIEYETRKNSGLTGTPRFCSLSAHKSSTQSRRDDLESLLYILIYLKDGKLSWQNAKGSTKKEKYENIYQAKRSISNRELSAGWPEPFYLFCRNIRSLKFKDAPDYTYLSDILLRCHRQL